MAKKTETHPWQEIEQQAFHAYREWPLWLVLRLRELQAHQTKSNPALVTQTDKPSTTDSSNKTVDTGAKL